MDKCHLLHHGTIFIKILYIYKKSVMSGALTQLVATGAQDVYLTGNDIDYEISNNMNKYVLIFLVIFLCVFIWQFIPKTIQSHFYW
ncbi:hypothetical protein AR158_C542R [Paramecium bursaria Chlorella virus AR158]|uniref:hypothetical protein n=1 Tax=Paramecium bursaria Chlorella virus AR158 TaxID=380598 RepID=UPI00015AA75B|nr:hypothetical protein AR158_C542R [Paramecium bursaria Chlorella virus AR158]ABU44087.1 hypothetical protein AR158_C542R [Paramecium bursaria Chlorella virus AR158]